MNSDGRVNLTEDESIEAELLVETMVNSAVARKQLAAELVLLRTLFRCCRRDRLRMPVNARRVIERFPAYSRSFEFNLQRTSNRLELDYHDD